MNAPSSSMATPNAGTNSTAPIYWLALGTFAIGTEGFMIAPLLPGMAADLRVSVWAVGHHTCFYSIGVFTQPRPSANLHDRLLLRSQWHNPNHADELTGLDYSPKSALISRRLKVFTGTVHWSSPTARGTKPAPQSLADICSTKSR
jgi:hypothetical protein